MANFTPLFDPASKTLTVNFSGNIDETTEFADMSSQPFQKVILNLENVKLINSIGVREWLKWIRNLPKHSEIVYRKCPRAIVVQMGLVGGFFREGTQIASFEVPYSCTKCSERFSIFFQKDVDYKHGKVGSLDRKCPKCGAPAELEVVESSYFGFLRKVD